MAAPTSERELARATAHGHEAGGCRLAEFAPAGAEECRGPMQRCHLISKRRLKELWREVHHGRAARRRRVPPGTLPRTLLELLRDPQLWWWGCERHHRLMDERRSLRIPRERLPWEVESFAVAAQLEKYLEDEYGEPVAAL